MATLIEEVAVGTTTLTVKFMKTVRVSSITNAHFKLYKYPSGSSNGTEVGSPFGTIAVATDYDTIARALKLFYSDNLDSLADYRFLVTGLLDAAGNPLPDEHVDFTAPIVTAPSSSDPTRVSTSDPIDIEDHSIRGDVFDSDIIASSLSTDFYVAETIPAADDPIISPMEADGRVTVKFSRSPAGSFVNTTYFKAQKKKLDRQFSRWETVPVMVSSDTVKPWVYMDFPSVDATPVYRTSGKTYFPQEYKFRVRVNKDVDQSAVTVPGGSSSNRLDLVIQQGATFRRTITYLQSDGTPRDITGYTAKMQIKTGIGGSLLYELNTTNSRLVIDGPNGRISMEISPSDSTGFSWTTGVYDLEITSPAATPVVTRLVEGRVTVSPEVTT